ncbi:MAG: alpha/beta family hydrolase [Pseudomonadota bacterium]
MTATLNEALQIAGPAGTLEARLTGPGTDRIAVLCHPHPQYGGSMHDGVLAILAECLADAGVASLRFNFRGVGASAGTHDGKGGERGDLKAVIGWVRSTYPEVPLLLGGYSFGASIVSTLADPGAVEQILLIAPPVGNLATKAPDGSIPVHVFVGDQDAFVDLTALEAAWTEAAIHVLPGADHFFGSAVGDLQAAISAALTR